MSTISTNIFYMFVSQTVGHIDIIEIGCEINKHFGLQLIHD